MVAGQPRNIADGFFSRAGKLPSTNVHFSGLGRLVSADRHLSCASRVKYVKHFSSSRAAEELSVQAQSSNIYL